MPAVGNNKDFVRPFPLYAIFVLCISQADIWHYQVFYGAVNGLSANAKPLIVVSAHCIVNKRQHHKSRFSATDCAVTYDTVKICVWKRHNSFLFFTYRHIPTCNRQQCCIWVLYCNILLCVNDICPKPFQLLLPSSTQPKNSRPSHIE